MSTMLCHWFNFEVLAWSKNADNLRWCMPNNFRNSSSKFSGSIAKLHDFHFIRHCGIKYHSLNYKYNILLFSVRGCSTENMRSHDSTHQIETCSPPKFTVWNALWKSCSKKCYVCTQEFAQRRCVSPPPKSYANLQEKYTKKIFFASIICSLHTDCFLKNTLEWVMIAFPGTSDPWC